MCSLCRVVHAFTCAGVCSVLVILLGLCDSVTNECNALEQVVYNVQVYAGYICT